MSTEPRNGMIAVVGIAGRFPGARDVREYWANLVDGIESVTVLTDEQLRTNHVPEHLIQDPDYVKARPMIEAVDQFDAAFFGYTPREAQIRDPQGRLFLETCHDALADAGYDVSRYDGAVGVFGGSANNVYGDRFVKRNRAVSTATGALNIDVANQADYLTTETSYRLGLSGPSVNVQTACSTSLVAVHLACQALRSHDCTLALAGGVEVNLPYAQGYQWQEGSIFSRTGHCRTFDAKADGTIFGSGVGVVALKRLEDARTDGDHIYAVIRASVVNNDGAARTGFTAPGMAGQRRLVTEALIAAAVDPHTISYVEAHGTGTVVGDPLEITALSHAFRDAGATDDQYCAIGSVKPNVGHLGQASGAAALIKVCLAMEHGLIPPSINFDEPNPAIDFASSPFTVNTAVRPWIGRGGPRRAGVNAFGIGGTNAHLIVEEPPAPEAADGRATGPQTWQVLPLSAQSPTAADRAVERLGGHLRTHDELHLRDVAYTLHVGRAQHAYRRAVVVRDLPEAIGALGGARMLASPGPARNGSPVFMFPGQGAQYPGMGRGLYRRYPVYRDAIDRCADLLLGQSGWDLRPLLSPAQGSDEQAAELLRQTHLTQPALFVVEYAVAELLRSWNITPKAMIGHSVGEYTAAHLAGVLSLPDALALVAARGELMHSMPAGTMLAVPLPENQVRPLAHGRVEVAAVNAPNLTVLTGPHQDIADIAAQFEERGIRARTLQTSHAFHSRMMEPILDAFRERVSAVELGIPRIPFISNVTGTWITTGQATDPAYWTAHLRNTVRFADGLTTVMAHDGRALVEVGPGESLTGFARQTLGRGETPVVPTMRHPRRSQDDEQVLLEAAARLWTAGVDVDWRSARPAEGRRVPLPGYPYERQRYWVEPDRHGADDADDDAYLPLDEAFFAPVWREQPIASAARTDPGAGWLVFSPGSPVLEALAATLRAGGASVVVVEPGDDFQRLTDDRYAIRPGAREDYRRLLDALPSTAHTRIVHGWTATDASSEALELPHVTAMTERGFLSLLYLAQELDRRPSDPAVSLIAVSANLQDVTGSGESEPAKALLLGPVMVANRELSGVSCRSVDLALPSRLPDEALVEQLLAECHATGAEPGNTSGMHAGAVGQVAWRGRKRWVWSYEPVRVDEIDAPPPVLRPGGTYLITGGLGGLGLAVAEKLANCIRARLVLVGRSEFPERERWEALVADNTTGDRLRTQLGRLLAIEADGGEIAVYRCDVADERRLRAVVDAAEKRFGAINGVFHAAGVAGNGLLAVKTREQAERVLAPKVSGTIALHRVLGGRVDFMSLFSSIATVQGNYGQVDYCGANHFLDAFARRLSASGTPVHSIGWAAWRGTGMVLDQSTAAPAIFRELERGARHEAFDHPLLSRRVRDGSGDVILSGTLTPTSHWVLTEHLVEGVPVLPGTASLEMIHAAFRGSAGPGVPRPGSVEISDVVFLGPIVVDAPRELRVVLRPDSDGFDATVCTAEDGRTGSWTEHVRARVRAVAGIAGHHDIAALRRQCGLSSVVPDAAADVSRNLVRFGPHWTNISMTWLGDGQEISRIELDRRFDHECALFTLHPSLADDALSNSQRLSAEVGRGRQYLPLSYERIVVHAPLPARFHTHVRHHDGGQGEVVSSDITLIGDDGSELVTVKGYSLRRVDKQTLHLPRHGEPEPAPRATSVPAQAAGLAGSSPAGTTLDGRATTDWGIEPNFGIAALWRVLAARPLPHLIVSAEELGHSIRRVAGVDSELLTREIGGAVLVGDEAMQRTLDTRYAAPETDLQRTLSSFWEQSLGREQVGIDDDFFELGGNSLVAVQLGARIRRHFGLEMPLATLFEQPTLRSLAAVLEESLLDKVAQMSDDDVLRAMTALSTDRSTL